MERIEAEDDAKWEALQTAIKEKQAENLGQQIGGGGKPLYAPIPVYEPPNNLWIKFWNWYTGKDVGYEGSGWGHGPRRLLAEYLNLPKTASNLPIFLIHSLLHEDSIEIT